MTIHFDANNYSHNIGCYQFYVLPGYINNILPFFCWPKHHFTFYCLANASLVSKVQNVLMNCFKPPNEATHLSMFHQCDSKNSFLFFWCFQQVNIGIKRLNFGILSNGHKWWPQIRRMHVLRKVSLFLT